MTVLSLFLGVVLLQQNFAEETLLARAIEGARRYTDAMRNLTAEETRRTELFDKNGKVEKQRVTFADIVVHQAGTDTLAEYRRVRESDGKAVKTREGNLEAFLQNLEKADSTGRQLELIRQESARYDLEDMQMYGMILNQAWPLEDERFRRAANFSLQGQESIRGRLSTVLRFEIPSALPESWRVGEIDELLRNARLSGRGRIWIDSETAEIWRYEAETVVFDSTIGETAVLDRMEFDYERSRFGVPTPTRIVWTSNTRVSREKGKVKLALRGRVTATYGDFQRFGADVKIVPLGVR